MNRTVLAAAAVLLAGCEVVTDFTLQPVAETTEQLCTDGKDNDFDGLTDCQDWNCSDQLPCCDIPVVQLVDDFDNGPADCATDGCDGARCDQPDLCAPDTSAWHTWPCPVTTECGGALHFNKTRVNCFESGVLSKVPVTVGPGLIIEADVVGRPEKLGYVEFGLTIQTEQDLGGSLDPCGSSQHVILFASIRQVYDDAGYRAVATFQQTEVGESAPVTDTGVPHRLAITVNDDRQVHYSLDGEEFAAGVVPVPSSTEEVRLAVTGVTETATVNAVRVQAGRLCHDPTGWQLTGADADSSMVFGIDPQTGLEFDADEVFSPSLRFDGDQTELYYTGCPWTSGRSECDPLAIGIGRAHLDNGQFVRDSPTPLFTAADVPGGELSGLRLDMQIDATGGADFRGYLAPGSGAPVFEVDHSFTQITAALPAGALGDFDEADVCCPSVVDLPDGRSMMFYAGSRVRNAVNNWQIGLAISDDGGKTFTRYADNPIFRPGPAGSFDSDGVFDPVVVYEPGRNLFHMWYEARDFFGTVTIGYAVLTDGINWSRFPGNPVIDPRDFGFESTGGPEVVLSPDGKLRMWLNGRTTDAPRRQIYSMFNNGRDPSADMPAP